jgi:hypothetical protein
VTAGIPADPLRGSSQRQMLFLTSLNGRLPAFRRPAAGHTEAKLGVTEGRGRLRSGVDSRRERLRSRNKRIGTGASGRSAGRVRTRMPSVPWSCEAGPVACGRGGDDPRTDHAERFDAGMSLANSDQRRTATRSPKICSSLANSSSAAATLNSSPRSRIVSLRWGISKCKRVLHGPGYWRSSLGRPAI